MRYYVYKKERYIYKTIISYFRNDIYAYQSETDSVEKANF